MRDEIVKYVQDPLDENVYLGVVVATGPGQVGWAKTHENDRDKWNRKLGLMIARGRAATTGAHRKRMLDKIPNGFATAVASMIIKSLAVWCLPF